jgi:hypothetical protein
LTVGGGGINVCSYRAQSHREAIRSLPLILEIKSDILDGIIHQGIAECLGEPRVVPGASGVAGIVLRKRGHGRIGIRPIPVAEIVDIVIDMLESHPELDRVFFLYPAYVVGDLVADFERLDAGKVSCRSKLDAGYRHIQIAKAAAQLRLIEAVRLAVGIEAVAE